MKTSFLPGSNARRGTPKVSSGMSLHWSECLRSNSDWEATSNSELMKLPRKKRGRGSGYSGTGEPLVWTILWIRVVSHTQTVRSWGTETERVGSFQSVILFQSKFVLEMQKDMEMERVKWGISDAASKRIQRHAVSFSGLRSGNVISFSSTLDWSLRNRILVKFVNVFLWFCSEPDNTLDPFTVETNSLWRQKYVLSGAVLGWNNWRPIHTFYLETI